MPGQHAEQRARVARHRERLLRARAAAPAPAPTTPPDRVVLGRARADRQRAGGQDLQHDADLRARSASRPTAARAASRSRAAATAASGRPAWRRAPRRRRAPAYRPARSAGASRRGSAARRPGADAAAATACPARAPPRTRSAARSPGTRAPAPPRESDTVSIGARVERGRAIATAASSRRPAQRSTNALRVTPSCRARAAQCGGVGAPPVDLDAAIVGLAARGARGSARPSSAPRRGVREVSA